MILPTNNSYFVTKNNDIMLKLTVGNHSPDSINIDISDTCNTMLCESIKFACPVFVFNKQC